MFSFTATIKTIIGTYYIDRKANRTHNQYAVMHNNGAVYLDSVQEALDWIKSDVEYQNNTAV